MDKRGKSDLESWYDLLDEVCIGLQTTGYREHGGSKLFRLLSKNKTSIKVFLNNYTEPSYIIVRYS
jgi:hypothetical protein